MVTEHAFVVALCYNKFSGTVNWLRPIGCAGSMQCAYMVGDGFTAENRVFITDGIRSAIGNCAAGRCWLVLFWVASGAAEVWPWKARKQSLGNGKKKDPCRSSPVDMNDAKWWSSCRAFCRPTAAVRPHCLSRKGKGYLTRW